ncbi:MAG TPA: hypothetical protein VII94_05865 [Candidatus Saccharimonadales bacterium]
MSNSDIFDSFVKIAQKKGLISEEKPTNTRVEAEHTEKDFPETNVRHDSLTIEQIGKLYGNKPQMPAGMEYEHNIMEVAHPDMLVISPSYDKLNGLIENENEGQNIRLHIVHKNPDGQLINRKYAKKDLLLALVRLGNELDNGDQEDLRKLADICLTQVGSQGFKKKAFYPLLIAGIIGLTGLLYLQQHSSFHSDGWSRDYQKAMSEINDLLNSNTHWGIIGNSYTDSFLNTVKRLSVILTEIDQKVQAILPILDNVQNPKTRSELVQISQNPDTHNNIQALDDLKAVIKENYPFIQEVMSSFSSESFKQRAVADKGILSSLTDSAEFLHGGNKGEIADDFDDVVRALETLIGTPGKVGDLQNLIIDLKNAQKQQEIVKQKLDSDGINSENLFNTSETPKTPIEPNTTPVQDTENPKKGLFDDLEKDFENSGLSSFLK